MFRVGLQIRDLDIYPLYLSVGGKEFQRLVVRISFLRVMFMRGLFILGCLEFFGLPPRRTYLGPTFLSTSLVLHLVDRGRFESEADDLGAGLSFEQLFPNLLRDAGLHGSPLSCRTLLSPNSLESGVHR